MNTRSAREHTIFALVHLLCKWSEQRPSSTCDLEVGGVVLYSSVFASAFILVPPSFVIFVLRLK
jgi:hypothetical protein